MYEAYWPLHSRAIASARSLPQKNCLTVSRSARSAFALLAAVTSTSSSINGLLVAAANDGATVAGAAMRSDAETIGGMVGEVVAARQCCDGCTAERRLLGRRAISRMLLQEIVV